MIAANVGRTRVSALLERELRRFAEEHPRSSELFQRARASFPGDAMRDETWDSWREDTLSGSPEQVIERVEAFAALGVEELILSPWALPFAVIEPEIVEIFADRVISAFR